jgi:hypothetical protein
MRRRRPGLREQAPAGVFGAVGEVEVRGVFGDQRPVPGPVPSVDLAQCGVGGEDGSPEVADRPGPLSLDRPQQVSEVVRRVRGASRQPAGHVVQPEQQLATLGPVGGAGLPGEGEPVQQAGDRGGIEPLSTRQQPITRCGDRRTNPVVVSGQSRRVA